jgi:hypothetical protein
MRKRPRLVIGSVLVLVSATFGGALLSQDDAKRPPLPADGPAAAQAPFPDFGHLPAPEQYKGAYFRLSQKYPAVKPVVDPKVQDILKIPFNENNDGQQNWLKYMLAVRSYCFEGNIEVDWDVEKNTVKRGWYHAPWQHWGRRGREGIRGLTQEATAQPGQLGEKQTDRFQSYAVGFYNDLGGFTIGQVWRDHLNPDYKNNKIHFPVGTVVFKLMFSQATTTQVPYLDPPVEWSAFAEISDGNQTRTVQKVRLLQMDIMVRDDRALKINGTGWVFGTYCYNGKVGSKNPFENLVPVGLQWGNDPTIKDNVTNQRSVKTKINPELKETIINPSADLPQQHLGWNGRLNGPLDYYKSSCMSCHSTAEYPVMHYQNPDFRPKASKANIQPGDGQWMRWFRNLKCGEPFSEQSNSTDFSLQTALGIQNFFHWRDEQGGVFTRKANVQRIEIQRGKD